MKSKTDEIQKLIVTEPRLVVKSSVEGASKMDPIRAAGAKKDTSKTTKK